MGISPEPGVDGLLRAVALLLLLTPDTQRSGRDPDESCEEGVGDLGDEVGWRAHCSL